MDRKLTRRIFGPYRAPKGKQQEISEQAAKLVQDALPQKTSIALAAPLLLQGKPWTGVVQEMGWPHGAKSDETYAFLRSALTPLRGRLIDVREQEIPRRSFTRFDVEDFLGLPAGRFPKRLHRLRRENAGGEIGQRAVCYHFPCKPALVDLMLLDGVESFPMYLERLENLKLNARYKRNTRELLRLYSNPSSTIPDVTRALGLTRQGIDWIKQRTLKELGLKGHPKSARLRMVIRWPDVYIWRAVFCGQSLKDIETVMRAEQAEFDAVSAMLRETVERICREGED